MNDLTQRQRSFLQGAEDAERRGRDYTAALLRAIAKPNEREAFERRERDAAFARTERLLRLVDERVRFARDDELQKGE